MDKKLNLEHDFGRDFGPTFRKFWGFWGFWGPVNKKRGESISLRAVHIFGFGWLMRNAMDPGFGRLFSPWSVDFYAYFLTK